MGKYKFIRAYIDSVLRYILSLKNNPIGYICSIDSKVMSKANSNAENTRKKILDNFSNLITLSLADDTISHEEQNFLDLYAKRLGLTDFEYQNVLLYPEKYQLNLAVNLEQRIEKLYNLIRIIYADHEIIRDEVVWLKRILINLGCSENNIDKVIEKAIHLIIIFEELNGNC